MVKCMKFFDRISETLGLYEEEDDELLEEEEPVKKAETAPKRIPRSTPAVSRAALPAESAALEKSEARSPGKKRAADREKILLQKKGHSKFARRQNHFPAACSKAGQGSSAGAC